MTVLAFPALQSADIVKGILSKVEAVDGCEESVRLAIEIMIATASILQHEIGREDTLAILAEFLPDGHTPATNVTSMQQPQHIRGHDVATPLLRRAMESNRLREEAADVIRAALAALIACAGEKLGRRAFDRIVAAAVQI